MNQDQVKGRVEEVKGKVKETTGRAMDNPDLEGKGEGRHRQDLTTAQRSSRMA